MVLVSVPMLARLSPATTVRFATMLQFVPACARAVAAAEQRRKSEKCMM